MHELEGALSARQSKVLCEHRVQGMVIIVSRRMSRLQAVSGDIIKSWDSRFHYVLWQEQRSLSYAGQILDVGCASIGFIQRLVTRHKGVPMTNNMSQQQVVRMGSCGPLVWLCDPVD